MIILFTDFGHDGPYLGQMKSVLLQRAPGVTIIDLFANAPCFDPKASAYLLAAYVKEFPVGSIFLCVVDPGVGSELRKPVICKIDDRWFVGPHNGLFNVVALVSNNATSHECWEIAWRPEKLSNSFHGRDLFAPVAAMLEQGIAVPSNPCEDWLDYTWPLDYPKIIYIDHFGNCMTGIRAESVDETARVIVSGYTLPYARTFSDVGVGMGFWYENANGLVEISVNQGHANKEFGVAVGDDAVFVID
jgi:S-adenosylmethionine hydrolase